MCVYTHTYKHFRLFISKKKATMYNCCPWQEAGPVWNEWEEQLGLNQPTRSIIIGEQLGTGPSWKCPG